MGHNKNFKNYLPMLAAAGFLSAFSVQAATSIETKNTEFTPAQATRSLEVKAQSWYNPTMGYAGWTHHSSWGYMKLKKGKPVTIMLQTETAGFHPGLTVWYRPQKKGFAGVNYMEAHFYNQFNDIYSANSVNTDDPANPVKLGKLQMMFVANAFDRDGMADPLPAPFDQSRLNRTLDGTPGKVSLTFTPEYTGVYQFAVGGINPDAGVEGLNNTDFYPVDVTVSFPE